MIIANRQISIDLVPLKKIICFAGLLFTASIIFFCVFYLTSDYQQLTKWYLSLNSCFYKSGSWSDNFFTLHTKNTGNILAIAAMPVAFYFSLSLTGKIRRYKNAAHPFMVSVVGAIWTCAVVALALIAGIWSWSLAAPAYDEVFSAVNCAELHPFQTLSYYMLPNNHIYFNFLNNILFGRIHHTIGTGRLFSLMSYIGVTVTAFYWLYHKIQTRLYALLCLLPIALQFMTWGLAAQARGYELQLLCAWISFVSLLCYLHSKQANLLRLNALCCMAGFSMLSTFLHYFLAQLAFILILNIFDRKVQWQFFKYQLYVVAIVFLLYLPAFCFSGIPAFTANRYVTPAYPTWQAFFPDFSNLLRYFINCCFSMIFGEDRVPNFVLFFLPLSLFFFKKKEQKLIGLFYVLLWLVFIVITLYMRRIPFTRNMVLHFSLTMGIIAYSFYVLIQKATSIIPSPSIRKATLTTAISVSALCYGIYLIKTDHRDIAHFIYYNDVNDIYTGHLNELTWIPQNATIAFSDECFFTYYLFRKDHPNAHRCPTGNEAYYIKRKDEPLPHILEGSYIKWRDGYEDYEYYIKK